MGQIADLTYAMGLFVEDLGLGDPSGRTIAELVSILKKERKRLSVEDMQLMPPETIGDFLTTVGKYENEDLDGLDRKDLFELVLETIDTL